MGRAQALKPSFVGRLTEEEARAKFIELRWAETGGRPTCPKCGCDAVNAFKCRPIYKCKKCYGQFSDTSGTPWAYRKIRFADLMLLVAHMAHQKQGKTALDLSDDLGVQYKTVLLWFHKMRAEIARQAASQPLSGEVEIDGAYFGGFVRPKNLKKTRKDLRKIPYRDNDRALAVVCARQRDGAIRTWVAKQETHARPFIAEAIMPGSVLFTDKAAGWAPLRGKFQLFQIDHSQAYSTPEACTNGAETLWALMRVMGRLHRHIAQNYLDLYAAEAAWTLQKGKKADGQAFRELMAWMSRPGRSPLAGYFQGRKRTLAVCKVDHTMEEWRPPQKRTRIDFIRKDGASVEFKPRRSRQKTWREGFSFMSAEAFVVDGAAVPDGPGVYAIFLHRGRDLLGTSGYIEHRDLPLWSHEGYDHAYTGETYGLRSRLRQHLAGDARASNLRETLLALQFASGGLERIEDAEVEQASAEQGLSEWLRANTVIGYKPCGYVRDVEQAILDASASPLNLVRRNPSGYTRLLHALRSRFRTEVMETWPKPRRTVRSVRR